MPNAEATSMQRDVKIVIPVDMQNTVEDITSCNGYFMNRSAMLPIKELPVSQISFTVYPMFLSACIRLKMHFLHS